VEGEIAGWTVADLVIGDRVQVLVDQPNRVGVLIRELCGTGMSDDVEGRYDAFTPVSPGSPLQPQPMFCPQNYTPFHSARAGDPPQPTDMSPADPSLAMDVYGTFLPKLSELTDLYDPGLRQFYCSGGE
jgi:hypothetical protein